MSTTEILQFCAQASGSGGNRLTPTAYAALSALLADGFVAGIANSAQLNTVWAQSSFMAAGLANWIVTQGISVPDDSNLSALVTEIDNALNTKILATAGGGSGSGNVIGPGSAVAGHFAIFDGTTGKLLKDTLGAPGTAATLNAGTSANQVVQLNGSAQIPALSGALLTNLNAAAIATGTVAAARLGSGSADASHILAGNNTWILNTSPIVSASKIVLGAVTIQFGLGTASFPGGTNNTFGTAFSSAPYAIICQPRNGGTPGAVIITGTPTASLFAAKCDSNNSTLDLYYIAIGPT